MSAIPLKASVGSAKARSAVPTRRDVGTGFRVSFAEPVMAAHFGPDPLAQPTLRRCPPFPPNISYGRGPSRLVTWPRAEVNKPAHDIHLSDEQRLRRARCAWCCWNSSSPGVWNGTAADWFRCC